MLATVVRPDIEIREGLFHETLLTDLCAVEHMNRGSREIIDGRKGKSTLSTLRLSSIVSRSKYS